MNKVDLCRFLCNHALYTKPTMDAEQRMELASSILKAADVRLGMQYSLENLTTTVSTAAVVDGSTEVISKCGTFVYHTRHTKGALSVLLNHVHTMLYVPPLTMSGTVTGLQSSLRAYNQKRQQREVYSNTYLPYWAPPKIQQWLTDPAVLRLLEESKGTTTMLQQGNYPSA